MKSKKEQKGENTHIIVTRKLFMINAAKSTSHFFSLDFV